MFVGREQEGLLGRISPPKLLCFQAEAMLCLNKCLFTSQMRRRAQRKILLQHTKLKQ